MTEYKNLDFTVVFKTFIRPECLDSLLNSINEYQDKYCVKFYEIIIVDDSDEEFLKENIEVINKYSNLNINHKICPFNSVGLSKGRNVAIDLVKTEYFLLCDDDNIFDLDCDLEKNLNLIKEKQLDILGGYYKNVQSIEDTNFEKHNFLGFITENETFDNYLIFENYYPDFCICTTTENFYFAKTESIKIVRYPDDMPLLEHNVFFLRAKQKGLKVGFTSSMFIKHFHRANKNKNYEGFRNRKVVNPIAKEVKGVLIGYDHIYTFSDYLHVDECKYIKQESISCNKEKKKEHTIKINLLFMKLFITLRFK